MDIEPLEIEWIGGIVRLPAYVTDEDEPYRPDALIWIGADGAILGSAVAKPHELVLKAGENLQNTIDKPMFGRPHSPTRVRVASAELAEQLRAGHPELDVVCAPTPELDEVLAQLGAAMAEGGATPHSYLSHEIEPAAIASFFKAAAALFRAQPWNVVPSDVSILSVTIEQLDLRDAVMSVIGKMGWSYGFLLFSSIDDFDHYIDPVDIFEYGEFPKLPPHLVLNYERGNELLPELRKEIAKHHWEVAGPSAYPWLISIDEDLILRPLTGKEVTIAEATARAFTAMLADTESIRDAWLGGPPVSSTLTVETHQGEIEVTLCAPFTREPNDFNPSQGILPDLAALEQDDEIDFDARAALEEELARRFAASPEAEDFDEVFACRFVMDLGAVYFHETIGSLSVRNLGKVLFEILPRKVSIHASLADAIVEELRAFYTFLGREFDFKPTDAYLRVLGPNAIRKLEAVLSDSRNFGMGKSLFMAGADAGFDMESREGIEAWMQSVRGKPLPPSVRIPGDGARRPAQKMAAQAGKNKRKASRKARKKNR